MRQLPIKAVKTWLDQLEITPQDKTSLYSICAITSGTVEIVSQSSLKSWESVKCSYFYFKIF